MSDTARLTQQFMGSISNTQAIEEPNQPQADLGDLRCMARAAMNYLRGNPEPTRDYECKFELGPLGIPYHLPTAVPPNEYGYDPIALGDTDCRMWTQYVHMREISGVAEPDEVEQGVGRRVMGYLGEGDLAWINPAAWTGEPIEGLWISKWASAKIMLRLAEDYAATGDQALKDKAGRIFRALKRLARWEGTRAYYPGGGVPVSKAGEYLRKGWAAEHSKNYPFIVEPCLHYANLCGDQEALDFAVAMAEGFLAGIQPGQDEMRIDPQTGAFQAHVHLHSHAFWGVAHLGAQLGDNRFLDWAQHAYEFVRNHGTDYGWFPEFIPHYRHRAEICVVGDMISTASWLAQRQPHYYDHIERGVGNLLRRCQFFLTPAFRELFEKLHVHRPAEEVAAAFEALQAIEGGFISAPAPNDWVENEENLGQAARHLNGIDMMGCCSPEGMRALWEAWNWTVEERPEEVRINLNFSVERPAATVRAYEAAAGRLDVQARREGRYLLRPPAWADREHVHLHCNGALVSWHWAGPDQTYVACDNVNRGDTLSLTWVPLTFQQELTMHLVPDQSPTYTIEWVGNHVQSVSPRGKWLPMF